jgi:hypothetical protein
VSTFEREYATATEVYAPKAPTPPAPLSPVASAFQQAKKSQAEVFELVDDLRIRLADALGQASPSKDDSSVGRTAPSGLVGAFNELDDTNARIAFALRDILSRLTL